MVAMVVQKRVCDSRLHPSTRCKLAMSFAPLVLHIVLRIALIMTIQNE